MMLETIVQHQEIVSVAVHNYCKCMKDGYVVNVEISFLLIEITNRLHERNVEINNHKLIITKVDLEPSTFFTSNI
jgi:hypothetical protein